MKRKIILKESELKSLIKKIISEALNPSQFREYVKSFNKERYESIFKSLGNKFSHDKNYYRIYIPLKESSRKGPVSNIEKEVVMFLNQNGYKDIDYIKGTCRFGDSKNIITIGKVLSRMKNNNLMNKFVSDESRKSLTSNTTDLIVVISRHPYDIAGSDTDRNWTNCMTMAHSDSPRVNKISDEIKKLESEFKYKKTFGNKEEISKLESKISNLNKELQSRINQGVNTQYIINDIKEGSLVSYLIRKDDKNINNPLSVLNIKPYVNSNDESDIILVSDIQMYGQGRPEFKQTVDGVLDLINGPISGLYCLNKNLYTDSGQVKVLKIGERESNFIKESFHKIKNILDSGYGKKLLINEIKNNIDYTISIFNVYTTHYYKLNLSEVELETYSKEFSLILKNNIDSIISEVGENFININMEDIQKNYETFVKLFPEKSYDLNQFIDYYFKNNILINPEVKDFISNQISNLMDDFFSKIK